MDRFEISIPFDWNEGDIVVTNSVGQAIIKQPIQPDKLSFDIKKLASSMYIYHITVDVESEEDIGSAREQPTQNRMDTYTKKGDVTVVR